MCRDYSSSRPEDSGKDMGMPVPGTTYEFDPRPDVSTEELTRIVATALKRLNLNRAEVAALGSAVRHFRLMPL